ncbi:MAG: helix-turn-helix domain-containing protein [Acidobacteriaceae bacterium]|nr:helix-turn-helix domain-containing protein [Acidobacteriaceae bacterium]
MPRLAALISLSEEEIKTLRDWSRRGKSEHRLVERARIILLAGEGRSNEQIAKFLNTRTARVSKWRQRFGVKRLAGLGDAERSGTPAKYNQSTGERVLGLIVEPAHRVIVARARRSRGKILRC